MKISTCNLIPSRVTSILPAFDYIMNIIIIKYRLQLMRSEFSTLILNKHEFIYLYRLESSLHKLILLNIIMF